MAENPLVPTLDTVKLDEYLKAARELEEKILAIPGVRETYLHLRWHTTHPGEECVVCGIVI